MVPGWGRKGTAAVAAAALTGMATRRGASWSWKPKEATAAGLDILASGEPSLADGGWMVGAAAAAGAGTWVSEDGKNKSRWSLVNLGVVGVSAADWWGAETIGGEGKGGGYRNWTGNPQTFAVPQLRVCRLGSSSLRTMTSSHWKCGLKTPLHF